MHDPLEENGREEEDMQAWQHVRETLVVDGEPGSGKINGVLSRLMQKIPDMR